jgi:hypothetical protein
MNQENKQFLDEHRFVYDEIIKAETAKKANLFKTDLIRILREEFYPGYAVTEDCVSCLFEVVRLLYTKYDQWLKEQQVKPLQPVKVHASFPKRQRK